MKLGSSEHYGWEQSRTVVIVDVLDGPQFDGEFAHLRVPDDVKGGPLAVMVRLRTGQAEPWREPQPGERIEVQAWQLGREQSALLELAAERGQAERWVPPRRNPDLWLRVEG